MSKTKTTEPKKACPTCNEFRHELCCKRCGVLCSYVGSFAPFCGVKCHKRFLEKEARDLVLPAPAEIADAPVAEMSQSGKELRTPFKDRGLTELTEEQKQAWLDQLNRVDED